LKKIVKTCFGESHTGWWKFFWFDETWYHPCDISDGIVRKTNRKFGFLVSTVKAIFKLG